MSSDRPPLEPGSVEAPLEGRRLEIRGQVQGVGFRPHVWSRARGLRGAVYNHPQGVTVEVWGEPGALDRFLREVVDLAPAAARIEGVEVGPLGGEPPADFTIEASHGDGPRRPSLPPDLSTCPACLGEISDPADRRYRYPFTNCTQCGPRFTIAWDVPYDRANTTMARFELCAECQREYTDPGDRRYHAQPNACPACGPHLRLLGPGAEPLPGDPLEQAARLLLDGRIVAIKGLGGVHLAVDATRGDAVARLRHRKHRDDKPLAVMVRDLAAAEEVAHLDDLDRALLGSVERPIALVRLREPGPIAPDVAPRVPRIGLMLPYTPLHHLLLQAVDRPLVMTSANLSGAPIVHRDEEALERLADVADAFLLHDRPITTRCDDSVALAVAGQTVLLRRSRGWVPRPIELPAAVPLPTLAVGAHLQNTFCLARGRTAWLGPHVGDLETIEAYEAFEEAIARLEAFTGVRPERVVHDLHPAYLSTRYAHDRGLPRVEVQHHAAHVAAVMADLGLEGPVIGLAFDGTGLGPDGAAWGGEVLVGGASGFERALHWRALPLVGGDLAVRQVWRLALAAVLEADRARAIEELPVFRSVDAGALAAVRKLVEGGRQVTPAHGVGRLFDAVGALALDLPVSTFEGQVPMACEWAAGAQPRHPYDCPIEGSLVDTRPLLAGVVDDLLARVPGPVVVARLHATVIEASARAVRAAARQHGRLPVVLSGGCFANTRLVEGLLAALPDYDVHLPRRVPPGDGGLALGQILLSTGGA